MEPGAAIAGVTIVPLRRAPDERALCDLEDLEAMDATGQAPRTVWNGGRLVRSNRLADPPAVCPASPGQPRPGDGA